MVKIRPVQVDDRVLWRRVGVPVPPRDEQELVVVLKRLTLPPVRDPDRVVLPL